ncbi:tetratricopeptide repeat-containing sensor histidine kinase [Bizionia sp.]|uniref:tetratricopeptide repeat-containing sensor histidine kinase n=1 Tax=Bizionia sp. TaxID=1954480 RepID=UPI003A925BC6
MNHSLVKKTTTYLVLFYLFLIGGLSVYGQQEKINQLKKDLLKNNLTDSAKIKVFGDLGWYYGNINIDSSFFFTKKGLELSIETKNQQGLGQSYNDLGIIFYRTSQYDDAIINYKKSLNFRKSLNDSVGVAGLYSKIAITFQQMDVLDSALFYNKKATTIYEALKMDRFVDTNLSNAANIYLNLQHYPKALEIQLEVLEKRKKRNNVLELAESHVNIGNIYQKLLDFENCKKYYDIAEKLGEENNLIRLLSPLYNNYGNIYRSEGNIKEALKYYEKAYAIRKTLDDEHGIASVTGNLAVLYLEEGKINLASFYFYTSIAKAKKVKAKKIESNAYKSLAILKSYQKELDSAFWYQTKFNELETELNSEKVIKQIAEIETKYETEKKEKEIAVQKEQLLKNELLIKNKNLYAILITSALLILGIISFGYYKRNQFKKKQLQKEIDLKDALSAIKTQNRLQEQRLRISRDLHDNIGSQLTFIISSIDNLKYVSKDIGEKLSTKLSEISLFTSDTIFQLRDTIWAMNKNEITFDDIHTRVLSFVEKAKTAAPNTSFNVDNKVDREFSFTSIAGINVFRVLQEAINNAIKYAEATEINILLTTKNDHFCIEICDNGKGFDIKTVTLGNGLSNMEKRMQEIGGTIQIDATENKGTCIELLLNK